MRIPNFSLFSTIIFLLFILSCAPPPGEDSNEDHTVASVDKDNAPNFGNETKPVDENNPSPSDTGNLDPPTIEEPADTISEPSENETETKGLGDLEIDPDEDSEEQPNETFVFPYRLNQPNDTYVLPSKLTEISAIAFTLKDELACVQDEKGNIYIYDMENGEINRKIDFWKDGDYEGLAFVKKSAYVLRMDGNIYQVKKFDSPEQETKKRKTFLDDKNDAEGLCFDARNNRLLVALKGEAGDGDDFKGKKAVYGFDLEEKVLLKDPVFLIDLQEVADHMKDNIELEGYRKMLPHFGHKTKDHFQPSEIGIHPITGNVYITSSVGKILMVLNQKGDLLHLESLEREILKQPEGMAFFKNGDLLISSEGKSGKGKIVKFNYQF